MLQNSASVVAVLYVQICYLHIKLFTIAYDLIG